MLCSGNIFSVSQGHTGLSCCQKVHFRQFLLNWNGGAGWRSGTCGSHSVTFWSANSNLVLAVAVTILAVAVAVAAAVLAVAVAVAAAVLAVAVFVTVVALAVAVLLRGVDCTMGRTDFDWVARAFMAKTDGGKFCLINCDTATETFLWKSKQIKRKISSWRLIKFEHLLLELPNWSKWTYWAVSWFIGYKKLCKNNLYTK